MVSAFQTCLDIRAHIFSENEQDRAVFDFILGVFRDGWIQHAPVMDGGTSGGLHMYEIAAFALTSIISDELVNNPACARRRKGIA